MQIVSFVFYSILIVCMFLSKQFTILTTIDRMPKVNKTRKKFSKLSKRHRITPYSLLSQLEPPCTPITNTVVHGRRNDLESGEAPRTYINIEGGAPEVEERVGVCMIPWIMPCVRLIVVSQ